MNLNSMMPFVIIFGLLAYIAFRWKMRVRRSRSGDERTPLIPKLAIAWVVLLLAVMLILFLIPPSKEKKEPNQASEPTRQAGGSP